MKGQIHLSWISVNCIILPFLAGNFAMHVKTAISNHDQQLGMQISVITNNLPGPLVVDPDKPSKKSNHV